MLLMGNLGEETYCSRRTSCYCGCSDKGRDVVDRKEKDEMHLHLAAALAPKGKMNADSSSLL